MFLQNDTYQIGPKRFLWSKMLRTLYRGIEVEYVIEDLKGEEVKYSVNTTKFRNRFCLSLLPNKANSFLYVNGVKIHQFKAKDSEIKPYPSGNISKECTVNNIKSWA